MENIPTLDFVWRPVNSIRHTGYCEMARRALLGIPERPFAYNHFENIGCLATKAGLIRRLKEYYERTPLFKQSNYTYDHSMAISFIAPTLENISDSPQLQQMRRYFHRFERSNFSDSKMCARQL